MVVENAGTKTVWYVFGEYLITAMENEAMKVAARRSVFLAF